MQLALPPDSKAAYVTRLMIAGVAVAGASLFAMTAPTPAGPQVQHRAVKLASGEVDWSTVIANAEANLTGPTGLETEAATASNELSTALTNVSDAFSGQFTTAAQGFETGIQNAIDGGWYGSDDGYVEGLFPGTIIGGPDSPFTSIGTLAEISQALSSGQSEQVFSYIDLYFLETLDHTLKPLLSPLLDETSQGATTLSIPVELSQIHTNLLETFGNYTELKALGDAVLAPEISVGFGLTQDLDGIAADFSTADYTQGLTDLSNLSSDLTNDLVNGWTTPAGETFTGLLNSGSILDDLLVTWPEQFVTALGSLGA